MSPRTVHVPPTVPASAGALVFDPAGRLLVLRPTYKSGWTLPGGEVEADGRSGAGLRRSWPRGSGSSTW